MKFFFAVLLTVFSSVSVAIESFVGRVTLLEATYIPTSVVFVMDAGNSTCPAGTSLRWQKADAENNKAIYPLLMAALTSGKKVRFHINNGDTTCGGQFLHLLSAG